MKVYYDVLVLNMAIKIYESLGRRSVSFQELNLFEQALKNKYPRLKIINNDFLTNDLSMVFDTVYVDNDTFYRFKPTIEVLYFKEEVPRLDARIADVLGDAKDFALYTREDEIKNRQFNNIDDTCKLYIMPELLTLNDKIKKLQDSLNAINKNKVSDGYTR